MSFLSRLIKPNFCFDLSHRRSTTVSLETRNLFTTQPLRPRSFLAITTLKLTMPNLKTLTKELRQEILTYLYPLPSISSNIAFHLAIHIFTNTRFSSHINFISRCLQRKVIPKGFRSNCHASIFSNVSNFNLKYLHEIQSRPFRVRNKLVSRQKMSKIEVQVFSSGPETKTFRLYVRITARKFIVSFDLTSV